MLIVDGRDFMQGTHKVSIEVCIYNNQLLYFLSRAAEHYGCSFVLTGLEELGFPRYIFVQNLNYDDTQKLNTAYNYLADSILHWNDYPDGSFFAAFGITDMLEASDYDYSENMCVINATGCYQKGVAI